MRRGVPEGTAQGRPQADGRHVQTRQAFANGQKLHWQSGGPSEEDLGYVAQGGRNRPLIPEVCAMNSQFAAAREFLRGAARRKDLVYILSKGKALIQEGIAHTSAIAVYQGRWADAVDTEWDSTAIAVSRLPAEKLIAVGEDGDVVAYVA